MLLMIQMKHRLVTRVYEQQINYYFKFSISVFSEIMSKLNESADKKKISLEHTCTCISQVFNPTSQIETQHAPLGTQQKQSVTIGILPKNCLNNRTW